MPRRKDKKASGVKYCRGYVDEHGQWNNGFYCPQWGGPGKEYCCGPETHKFCCPQPIPEEDGTFSQQSLPVMIGLAMGSLIIAMLTFVGTCYFCRCCWLYRRRKRLHHDGHPHVTGGPVDYAVNYTVCPHSTYLRDGASCYPMDDPPPYPGESSGVPEEKQPLNPTQLCVAIEGPDDSASPVTYSLARDSSPPHREYMIPNNGEQSENRDNIRRQRCSDQRCYHDHVTIFSNHGAGYSSNTTPPTRCCPFNSRCRHIHRGGTSSRLIKPQGERSICYANYNTVASGRKGSSSVTSDMKQEESQCSTTSEEFPNIIGPPIAGVVPTPFLGTKAPVAKPSTSSGQYSNEHIDRYLNDCDGLTPLVRSNTFTLQARGDIELTTFKLPSSTDTEDDDAKTMRRSIELGSFIRTPLAPPPIVPSGSFIQLPTGDAGETSRNSLGAFCLPNGDILFDNAAGVLNIEDDEITDLTVQVKPQG